jgi:hypothetical protein
MTAEELEEAVIAAIGRAGTNVPRGVFGPRLQARAAIRVVIREAIEAANDAVSALENPTFALEALLPPGDG